MNIELMLRVRDQIAAHPEHFDMEQWFSVDGCDGVDVPSKEEKQDILSHQCGTTACIAGWAVVLSETKLVEAVSENWFSIKGIASELLDVEYQRADYIFREDHWPNSFRKQFLAAETRFERAAAATDYLTFLIGEEYIPEVTS